MKPNAICSCKERMEAEINSQKDFETIKEFFEAEAKGGVYREVPPQAPYYSWTDGTRKIEWFATKWYKCTVCGCLWEFQYPEFPAKGFVRKFPSGKYSAKE